MKKLSIYIFIVLALLGGACSNYLDVNDNPNQPTSVTANLILPQALVATAINLNGYNAYGAQIGGYAANGGGYGGFNELVSYKYTSSNYTGQWSGVYDNLEDYQYIINTTAGDFNNSYYYAAALIMKAYNYQLLVDTYNSVPYTKALLGSANLTPTYDDPKTVIYPALAHLIDTAIAVINSGAAAATLPASIKSYDPMFAGDMPSWVRLANTVKLRLMIRGKSGGVTFSNTDFDAAGFLSSDAMINPGYTRDNNRENPGWNSWVFSYTGSPGIKSWIPTTWIYSFYDGTKLSDPWRGGAAFYQFQGIGGGSFTAGSGYTPSKSYTGLALKSTGPGTSGSKAGNGATVDVVVNAAGSVASATVHEAGHSYAVGDVLVLATTPSPLGAAGSGFSVTVTAQVAPVSNRLGIESTDVPPCPIGSAWYNGVDRGGTSSGSSTGIYKGPNAGFPLFTAAESNFLQAEAALEGIIIPGSPTVASAFNAGITASFKYLYMYADGTFNPAYAADANTYLKSADSTGNPNLGSYIVNITKAVSPAQQLEAIITQKYIALNYIHSHEGWNEYRRTGYPVVSGNTATTTFASSASQITDRPDRLPTRIMYPSTEAAYNPANVPHITNSSSSLIFWAKP